MFDSKIRANRLYISYLVFSQFSLKKKIFNFDIHDPIFLVVQLHSKTINIFSDRWVEAKMVTQGQPKVLDLKIRKISSKKKDSIMIFFYIFDQFFYLFWTNKIIENINFLCVECEIFDFEARKISGSMWFTKLG